MKITHFLFEEEDTDIDELGTLGTQVRVLFVNADRPQYWQVKWSNTDTDAETNWNNYNIVRTMSCSPVSPIINWEWKIGFSGMKTSLGWEPGINSQEEKKIAIALAFG